MGETTGHCFCGLVRFAYTGQKLGPATAIAMTAAAIAPLL